MRARPAGGETLREEMPARIFVSIVVCLLFGAPAFASSLVARDATDVKLEVNRKGQALITYRRGGTTERVLAWGAVDGQGLMRLDYSGGYRAFGRPVWKTFADASRAYDGPPLPWLVVARTAPDGSHWALQAWQRKLPNFGAEPQGPLQRALELHVSHWRGELPKLEVWTDWVFHGRYEHVFGRLTYKGQPVFGFGNTPAGNPTDPYGRNLYLDTFNSAYGPGWERENSFLTHRPRGNFCYGFYPHGGVPGTGERYRITVLGPGAAPIVVWEGPSPGPYDPAKDVELNAIAAQVAGDDPRCQRP